MNYFPTSVKERAEEIINIIGEKIGGYVTAQTMASAICVLLNELYVRNIK